jgi:hypothetical protein
MANLVKWESESVVQIFPGTNNSSDADIKDLASTKGIISAAIDNTDGNQYILFALTVDTDSAITAGDFSLWMIKSIDGGTTYERGSVSSRTATLPTRAPDVIFPCTLTADAWTCSLGPVLAPPCHFKILLVNNSGQDCADSNGASQMSYMFANDEIQ